MSSSLSQEELESFTAETGGIRNEDGDALKCTLCSDTFQDVLALVSHIDGHSLCCQVCQKEFTSKEFLDQHMKSHRDPCIQQNTHTERQIDTKDSLPNNSCQEKHNTEQNGKSDISSDDLKSKFDAAPNTSEIESCDALKNKTDIMSQNTINVMDEMNKMLEECKPSNIDKNSKFTMENDKETINIDSKDCDQDVDNGPEDKNTNDSDVKEKENKSISNAEGETPKAKTDKPYHCSKCKYSAKCIASVHIHQRRNHPGEFATVISTLPENEDKQSEVKKKTTNIPQNSGVPDSSEEDDEDEEVRTTLENKATESEGENDKETTEPEYRCSMCSFTAKDTQTVFEHQRSDHPSEWQLSDFHETEQNEDQDPRPEEGMEGQNNEDDEPMDSDEAEENINAALFHLPTELDQYSQMGRSIIAGVPDYNSQQKSHVPEALITDSPSKLPGNKVQAWQGYNRLTGKFHCPNCPAYFYEPNQHTRHLAKCMRTNPHHSGNIGHYRCLLCKRVFATLQTLQPHMISHQRYFRAFRCSICGYNAKFNGTIIAHIRQRHPGESSAKVDRIATTQDIQNIPNRWEQITDENAGTLEAEDAQDDPDLQRLFGGMAHFSPKDDQDALSSGSSTNHGSPSEMAFEELSEEALLACKVGNSYVCPECPVMFRDPEKLKAHVKVHGGIKNHTCDICNKSFTRSEHLRRHRFVHATTKPYACSICLYSSKRLDNVQKHQKVKHAGEDYRIITVDKEMIEAEIAANSDGNIAQLKEQPSPKETPKPIEIAPKPSPTPAPAPPPLQPQQHPYIISQSPPKPKRGRPRNISSPDDMFYCSKGPDYAAPNTTAPTIGAGQFPLYHPSGLSLNMLSPLMQNPTLAQAFGNRTANPFQPILPMPNFDLSKIAAAAAASAASINSAIMSGAMLNQPKPEMLQESSQAEIEQPNSSARSSPMMMNQESRDCDSPSFGSNLGNRGRYQCHVCERPFSYLKPFKKHLLCHGTFMPYQCSECKYQAKRRDIVQDHQREAHPGKSCSVISLEPTEDMHDMMDTYIQKQPQSDPPLNDPQTSSENMTGYDEKKVDPQIDIKQLGVELKPKHEIKTPQKIEMKTPQKDNPHQEAKKQGANQLSPSPISQSPSASPGSLKTSAVMSKAKPKRMIKFKVLSSHNRTPTSTAVKDESGSPLKRAAEIYEEEVPKKISKVLKEPTTSAPPPNNIVSDSQEIRSSPRASSMGLRPRQSIITPKQYEPEPPVNKSPKTTPKVMDLQSNRGTPRYKQGDNHRYTCSMCDQRFAYEKPFKRHLVVHDGFMPYKCNVCSHLTASRDTMKIHQAKKHPSNRNPGITVLDPTPAMVRDLIKRGLFKSPQKETIPVKTSNSEDEKEEEEADQEGEEEEEDEEEEEEEETPESKSIVEAAIIEKHIQANAMKTPRVEKQSDAENGEPSFYSILGLKPAKENENDAEECDALVESADKKIDTSSKNLDESFAESDDMSDMPVDEALFVNANSAPFQFGNSENDSPLFGASLDDSIGDNTINACEYCGKTFNSTTKLEQHLLSHTGVKAYECQICFKKLTRLEHLKRHLLTHGNIKPYRCSVCEFDAKRLDILQVHMQTTHPKGEAEIVYMFTPSVMVNERQAQGDSDEKEYTCSMCATSFPDIETLIEHQKIHSIGAKTYECFVCNKSFTRPEHLKRHRIVHDDTKPYRCSECGFHTKRLDGMKEHQRSRHPSSKVHIIDTSLPETPSPKRKRGRPPKFPEQKDPADEYELVYCNKCNLAFYDPERLEQHKPTHTPSPPKNNETTCHICGVKVSQAKHLRRHMLLHQDHVPYQCSQCGYTAKRTDHMKLHFRKSHPNDSPQIIYVSKEGTATNTPPVELKYGEEALKDSHCESSAVGESLEEEDSGAHLE